MLNKWDLVDGSSREDIMTLTKELSFLPKGRDVKYTKCSQRVLLLLLVKFVYCKVISNNKHLKPPQLFLNDENILKDCPLIINRQIITDKIIMNENNNLTISYENFMKCLRILSGFQIMAEYSYINDVNSVNNYIQMLNKHVTKSFIKNVEKIDKLRISRRLEKTAKNCPIIFYRDNKLMGNYYTVNIFESFNKISDWLLERCKHIETFEIGVFAAISQTLGTTEGLEAFENFVKYAESLDDNNRVNLINKLIAYYNSFNNVSNLELIPNIIKSLNLCESLKDFPNNNIKIKTIIEADVSNSLLEDFNNIAKSDNRDDLEEAIQTLTNDNKNFPKTNEFERENTLSVQNIINQYYNVINYRHYVLKTLENQGFRGLN